MRIHRNRSIQFAVILLAWVAVLSGHPNVILIVTDDQGYGDLSCHGNPWLETPHLDRMYAGAVRLDDFHVDPVCTPTRAALMTGRYSARVGAWAVTEGRQLLNPDETTMAEVFAEAGYRTAMYGKWHLGDTFPYAPRFRGFEDVVRHMAGGIDEIGNPPGNDYFVNTLYRNGQPEKIEKYCTDVFFDETLRRIREVESEGLDQPFFIYLALNAMHGPFTVEKRYSDRFEAMGLSESRSKFYGMIENFDENLGRLRKYLRESELADETIIVFMGDNGTAGGSSGRPGDGFNAGMRAKKGSVYDGGHRVACFIEWPGGLPAGFEIEALTTHRDLFPTLLELCKLPHPGGVDFDGQSLLPLVRGEGEEWPDRSVVVERQADEPVFWENRRNAPGNRYPHFAVLTERWRLADGELYDIVSDPGQEFDLAERLPSIRASMMDRYREYYHDVYSHGAAYTRFQIGNEEENPTTFTVRDWHPESGAVIWKKEHLVDDERFINGFWAIEAMQAGRYRFRLGRHELENPEAIGADKATLQIGS